MLRMCEITVKITRKRIKTQQQQQQQIKKM